MLTKMNFFTQYIYIYIHTRIYCIFWTRRNSALIVSIKIVPAIVLIVLSLWITYVNTISDYRNCAYICIALLVILYTCIYIIYYYPLNNPFSNKIAINIVLAMYVIYFILIVGLIPFQCFGLERHGNRELNPMGDASIVLLNTRQN